MVERVLRREHYKVESARDGFEAIQKLSKNDYATVLLDLMMPRVDGQGVLRYLEEERGAEGPNVIIMTAHIPQALEVGTSANVCRVLPKPFDIHQLVQQVRQCATGQPSGRPPSEDVC